MSETAIFISFVKRMSYHSESALKIRTQVELNTRNNTQVIANLVELHDLSKAAL